MEDNDDDTDIELDENDVYVDKSGTVKCMTENVVSGLGKWVIMGDVNVSLNLEDHSEGMSNFTQDMIDFQECINEIEIEDINSSGLHFTWIKSLLNPSSSILKKIDMVMGNNAFLSKYSTANVLFLPYGISDHSPAILKVPQAMKKKNKSFRVSNYVIDKMEFKELVKEKWNIKIQRHHTYSLVKKLKSLKPHLHKLNWKNSNLFERVVVLKVKLYDVQSKIDMNPTDKDLRIEGVELLKDYKEAVLDEEKLLRQKTKITWLKEGDKNLSYFHKVLKGRINRNKIMSVCAENGFLGISLAVTRLNEDDDHLFVSKISEGEAKNMIREINDEEIKKALFDIDDDKAPGPDGFTSKFSKKAWAVIKEEFYSSIKEFFRSGKLLGEINATLISLVPKSLTPQKVSDYRPIACCNVIYKCIMMEMLNLLVKDEISKEKAFKYHFGCKQLRITHLCFADDLIMLCLYPNLGKCTMFCGNIDDETKENISNIFPFKEGKLPVRYLGVPLVTKKIGVADSQLIASVLGSMQVYWGSIFLLLKPVINEIEGMFKKFLWNNSESCKGKSKVAWLELCKPKDQGDLGFKSLELWNKTLLVKHLWNVASRKESLWDKWINVVKLKKMSV
ncbi:RNA-directed DNA polymerase, eukaryota, reverse transcriptase zinc-binding domain protein [Tanacetum coccineum]